MFANYGIVFTLLQNNYVLSQLMTTIITQLTTHDRTFNMVKAAENTPDHSQASFGLHTFKLYSKDGKKGFMAQIRGRGLSNLSVKI